MEGMHLDASNIGEVIASIRAQLPNHAGIDGTLIIPRTIPGEIDRNTYKGRGRPRKSDYERIDFLKLISEVQSSSL